MEDYSRLNFKYTLLSKRKLKWFVDNGKVSNTSRSEDACGDGRTTSCRCLAGTIPLSRLFAECYAGAASEKWILSY